jgi:hypothetical protein
MYADVVYKSEPLAPHPLATFELGSTAIVFGLLPPGCFTASSGHSGVQTDAASKRHQPSDDRSALRGSSSSSSNTSPAVASSAPEPPRGSRARCVHLCGARTCVCVQMLGWNSRHHGPRDTTSCASLARQVVERPAGSATPRRTFTACDHWLDLTACAPAAEARPDRAVGEPRRASLHGLRPMRGDNLTRDQHRELAGTCWRYLERT